MSRNVSVSTILSPTISKASANRIFSRSHLLTIPLCLTLPPPSLSFAFFLHLQQNFNEEKQNKKKQQQQKQRTNEEKTMMGHKNRLKEKAKSLHSNCVRSIRKLIMNH